MIPNEIAKHLPSKIQNALCALGQEDICDIRLIAGAEASVFASGTLIALGVVCTRGDIQKSIESICGGSLYAIQDKLRLGFVTLCGGHRVGVCGSGITKDGAVTHLRDISALSFRLSREVKGAAKALIPHIVRGGSVLNTLIVSPPCCGKTTLLRDSARILGSSRRVCVIDERGEIAAMRGGEAQNDVGRFTMVLDGIPKDTAMLMALRSLSPEVLITDELGGAGDEAAIEAALKSGVSVLCSAHGRDENDVRRRGALARMVRSGAFEKIVILSARRGAGTIERVI